MNLVLDFGPCIDQCLTSTSYASQISVILGIDSGGRDEIIEAIYRDSFRVEFIGFLVLNVPDLICIGQDKFDMTFQNGEDRIPKTSRGFYSQPLASVV